MTFQHTGMELIDGLKTLMTGISVCIFIFHIFCVSLTVTGGVIPGLCSQTSGVCLLVGFASPFFCC